ncbi:SRPBCC family protein [Natronocalculus amylovorans]|uniref:SRPBCC family protein n=1 Tax=Natronocalculus amylovorans TaxID=2917812 RepID=A0AAE3K9Y2_9EURY|nr:SRPBCC family protein [Natronocalculus amylovorans]MCL9818473.1 SRPBCC family protein [Natronocalculus amylovorans]
MPTYSRRTRIAAPLSTVWDFHSTIDGLRTLTPEWMHLDIVSVHGPDGELDPNILETGSQIEMSMQPFGVGPRQSWISRITERERKDGYAMFRDDMLGGPFALWVHTHEFYGDGDETILVDTVEYELPFGPVGRLGNPFSKVGFEGMFRDRHTKTKAVLE